MNDLKPLPSLKCNYEFRRLYSRGKSVATANIVVYCRRNGRKTNRLGITVSTKYGKAVRRNKVRRRLREICRLNQNKLTHGHDLVIVVRMKSRDVEYARLEADFLDSCGQLGILERAVAQR